MKKAFILGFTLGLIAFFRIELSIVVIISLILVEGYIRVKQIKKFKPKSLVTKVFKDALNFKTLPKKFPFVTKFLVGLTIFGIIYLLLLLLHGSLLKFLHDIFILAFIASPAQMGLPIPPDLRSLYRAFLIINLLLIFINALAKNKNRLFLSVVNSLLFISALGRSDFVHLIYSLVIFIPTAISTFLSSLEILKQKDEIKIEKKQMLILLVSSVIVMFLGYRTIYAESMLFLMLSVGAVLLTAILVSKNIKTVLLLSIVGLAVFSVYYKTDLGYYYTLQKPRLGLHLPGKVFPALSNFPSYFQKTNYAGDLIIPDGDRKTIDNMAVDINKKSLFVYPTNPSFYYEFQIKNPTRYLFFNGEYTDFMENETISDLKEKKVNFVLYTPGYMQEPTNKIHTFIVENYTIIKTYELAGQEVQLLELKSNFNN